MATVDGLSGRYLYDVWRGKHGGGAGCGTTKCNVGKAAGAGASGAEGGRKKGGRKGLDVKEE
jgi:hypothetical protein